MEEYEISSVVEIAQELNPEFRRVEPRVSPLPKRLVKQYKITIRNPDYDLSLDATLVLQGK